MNPPEFLNISGDQDEVIRQRDRSNLQIHWPDNAAPHLKIVTNRSIPLRTAVIERKRNHLVQCADNQFSSHNGVLVFFRTMQEFGTDRRTRRKIRHRSAGEPVNQSAVPAFEHLNPDIAVEQVAHHQVLAGGNGSSGGRSNSASPRLPIKSANSGMRRFISSKLGGASVPATSDITLRTRDSNTRAFSGSRRSRVRSSSKAIVVTTGHCHGDAQNSTPHFQTS